MGKSPTENESLSKLAVQGLKWSYLSIVLQAALQLGVISILARLLTPADFGLVGIALIFTNFVERVGFIGVGPALVQRKELHEDDESVAFSLSVWLGLLLLVALYLAAPAIADFFREPVLVPVLRVTSVTFLIESFATVPENLLQRDLRFRQLLVVTNSAYFFGNGLVAIGLALSGFGVWSLVIGTIAMRLLKASLLLRIAPQRFVLRLPLERTRSLLSMGFGFSLGRLLSYVALNGDNFIVGRLLGSASLGMYGRAYQLMTLPATYFGQVLEKVLFPTMSRKQEDREGLARLYLMGIEASALVGCTTSVMMYALAPEIIAVLFGPRWSEVVPTLQILSTGIAFRLCYKNSDTLIRALGAVYRHASRQWWYTVTVVGGAYLGSAYGLEGVACAVVFAVIVNYALLSELGLTLLAVKWSDFARAHLPALWVAGWVAVIVPPVLGELRTAGLHAFLILLSGSLLGSAVSVLAMRSMPLCIRPRIAERLLEILRPERFGGPGRLVRWILATAA